MANLPVQTSDIRGVSKLLFNAVHEVTHVVESMHLNISRVPFILGQPKIGPARGITGFVYRSIRAINGSVEWGLDALLEKFAQPSPKASSLEHSSAIAILNGVLGDYLEATKNPLAIQMRFYRQGRPIPLMDDSIYPPSVCDHESLIDNEKIVADEKRLYDEKLMIFLHGLCANDLAWKNPSGIQPETMAAELGFTPVFLRYNSGRHISTNGREFAIQLEHLINQWPVTPKEIVLVGYSMGGLISRSACYYAEQNAYHWRQLLTRLYCVASPHHGSYLERGGYWLQRAISMSPYSYPLSRLTAIRSAGITDLRHGNVLDEDWEGVDRFHHGQDRRTPLPLPEQVACYAMGGVLREEGKKAFAWGDGIVQLSSALGQHKDARFDLCFPAQNCYTLPNLSHFDLISHNQVYTFIRNTFLM
jgi:pimeloyl-ACP methyl ester carboxylesterase